MCLVRIIPKLHDVELRTVGSKYQLAIWTFSAALSGPTHRILHGSDMTRPCQQHGRQRRKDGTDDGNPLFRPSKDNERSAIERGEVVTKGAPAFVSPIHFERAGDHSQQANAEQAANEDPFSPRTSNIAKKGEWYGSEKNIADEKYPLGRDQQLISLK